MSAGKPSQTTAAKTWSSVVASPPTKPQVKIRKNKSTQSNVPPSSSSVAATEAAPPARPQPVATPPKSIEDSNKKLDNAVAVAQKTTISWAALARKSIPSRAVTAPQNVAESIPKLIMRELEPRKPTSVTPVSRSYTGWASLPPELLFHHLFEVLKTDSRSIKASRLVCHSWYRVILLPRVSGAGAAITETNLSSFSLASQHCVEFHLTRHIRYSKEAKLAVKCGDNIRSLIIDGAWGINTTTRLIKLSPKLQSFTSTDFFVDNYLTNCLQLLSKARDLRAIHLEVTPGHPQYTRPFLECTTLPVTKLHMVSFTLDASAADALAAVISRSVVLEELELRQLTVPEDNNVIINSIRENRSLRKFICIDNTGSKDFLPVVANHPTIKEFRFNSFEIPYAKDLLDFYLAADNLEVFNFNHRTLAYNAAPYANQTAQSWLDCIARGKNFNRSNVADIARVSKPHIGEIARALRRDPTFKALILSTSVLFSGPPEYSDPAFRFSEHLLDSNMHIEDLTICPIADGRTEDLIELCGGLARAKALKTFKIAYKLGQLSNTAIDTLFASLSRIPTLEDVRISGPVPKAAAASICSALKRFKKLRFIELIDSQLEANDVIPILVAAAEARSVKVLHLPRASIKGTNADFNKSLSECVKNCSLESLSFFGAALDGGTISALLTAFRQLPTSALKYLDLTGINIHPLVRKNLDSFIAEMRGLVVLNRTFEEQSTFMEPMHNHSYRPIFPIYVL